ncbi:MAG: DNA polymerase I [Acidimicrobiaceae bacterium]|nr:DNA polymerase I [Acidimicrobiaceae bacterium]MYA74098.1 DNA polymerase I [Acidimicrobiaceae bacterium]MYG55303.1 DNA polymerase I [Acidimicrobiaceae bacterium]MYJ99620.1 DNA polymerase I [Acidimicrobiaceae bacterium]
MAKLMLIDGNSLVYRAFFALPTDMATASGQVTNAVYGFTSMLIYLLKEHEPDRIVVAFDRPEPTFRHELTPTYKAQRESAPDILRQQMGLVREVLDVLAMPVLDKAGYEADDIIATLATQGRDVGEDVIIVTGDRDSYQLVEDPHVKVLYNKRGVSDYAFYDEAGIKERTGVAPSDYVQYAALRGDNSDNLPGVPGVGEKTAAKLINERGGIDGIYASLDEFTPKLRENLSAHEADVRNNVEMMALVRDLELPSAIDDLVMGEIDQLELSRLFEFLEFRSLQERLSEVLGEVAAPAGGGVEVLEAEITVYETPNEAVGALSAAGSGSGVLAVAVPEHGIDDGLAFVTDGASAEVGFVPGSLLKHQEVLEALSLLLGADGREVAMHGAKATARRLLDLGVDLRHLVFDTRLAAYLLNPAETAYDLDKLLKRHTEMEMPESAAALGQLDLDGTDEDLMAEPTRHALAVDRLVEPMRKALDVQGLSALNDELEVPLVRVLARMEQCGIAVDREALVRIRDELTAETEQFRAAVIADAGHEFNVNSTKQLREVLFEELELTPLKKTKTGYSTDAQTLEKIRDQHQIVENLLRFREVEKLRSTYGEGLVAEIGPNDRIRATFNQTVARTGRLSSDAPNLHNIPVRSDRGRVFRTAFVAPTGHKLLVADYDQIELRCIAHLAEDPGLIEAFEAGDDIHTATASKIFHIAPDEVGIEQRSSAKMVSYGLAYGMESYGLAQRLNIGVAEAAEILDSYFGAFPAVKQYMDDTVKLARERGYTETLFGRRRQIPELSASNRQVRQAGERQAMNAGIQGLAADIFKVALVRLDEAIETTGVDSRIVLQVHDEIILESPDAEVEQAKEMTTSIMRDAFELRVPLEIDLQVASTWAGAKG